MRPTYRSAALVDFATVVVRLDVSRGCIDGRPSAEPNGVRLAQHQCVAIVGTADAHQAVTLDQGITRIALGVDSKPAFFSGVNTLYDAVLNQHVNPGSKEEWPPIYYAAQERQLDPLEMLLRAGADPDAPAPDRAFVDQGAPPGSRVTALSVAVALCRDSTVKTLLRHAARKDVLTPNGQSLNDGACSSYDKGSQGAVFAIQRLLNG